MLIRPSTPADIDAISAMVRLCYGTLFAEVYTAEVLAIAVPHMAHVPMDLAQSGTYFVADIDGDIVGAAGWSDGPQGVTLRKVAVHPAYLGQGIGRALMTHVHTTAHDAGHSVMHCDASLNAVPFYEALGYVRTGQINIDIGAPDLAFEAVLMQLRIR